MLRIMFWIMLNLIVDHVSDQILDHVGHKKVQYNQRLKILDHVSDHVSDHPPKFLDHPPPYRVGGGDREGFSVSEKRFSIGPYVYGIK